MNKIQNIKYLAYTVYSKARAKAISSTKSKSKSKSTVLIAGESKKAANRALRENLKLLG